MSDQLPVLDFGRKGGGREEVLRLVTEACAGYAARNTRKAADALCAAESVANHDGLHREAAKLRKAIVILAQRGKPRLLVRGPEYLSREK